MLEPPVLFFVVAALLLRCFLFGRTALEASLEVVVDGLRLRSAMFGGIAYRVVVGERCLHGLVASLNGGIVNRFGKKCAGAPHGGKIKFGGSRVFMKPAASGTGVKAGGAMRAVLESVGVHDVLCKCKGSSNPHNLVKATVLALTEMRDAYSVAEVRGISLKKVFNG